MSFGIVADSEKTNVECFGWWMFLRKIGCFDQLFETKVARGLLLRWISAKLSQLRIDRGLMCIITLDHPASPLPDVARHYRSRSAHRYRSKSGRTRALLQIMQMYGPCPTVQYEHHA